MVKSIIEKMTEHLSLLKVRRKYKNETLRKVSLCFLIKGNEVLLALKKRGFAAGKWNGSGGKANPKDKDIKATAKRETFEETTVLVKKLKKVGILNFWFENQTDWNQQVVVFITREWTGTPTETEEMAPKWFNISSLPFDKMWEDDVFWLPKVLSGKIVEGNFLFDENQKMLEHKVKEVA